MWVGIVLFIALLQAKTNDVELVKTGLILLFLPLSGLIQLFVRRERPATIYAHAMRIKSYSFPSSHSYVAALGGGYVALVTATALSAPWSIVLPWLIVSMVVTIAVSRVHLGAHYPSDVSVGLALGASILLAIIV